MTTATNGNGQTDASRRPASFIAKDVERRAAVAAPDPNVRVRGAAPNRGDFPLPHVMTFQGLVSSIAKVYRPSDEAINASLDNARFMRNDVGIMECLEARQRAVSLLNYHLEPENEHSPDERALCDELTKIVNRIPCFLDYRYNMQHAIWYGKYGIQHQHRWGCIGGKQRVFPQAHPVYGGLGWLPINGDKLVFRHDDANFEPEQFPGQVGIRVASRWKNGDVINGRHKVEATDRGLAYFLAPWERKLVAIHKHMIEDGAYESITDGGMIHGIGIRSRIYWDWFQKQEALAFLMEYLERSAGGIELWYYDEGNPDAKRKTEEAALNRLGGQRNVITVPRPRGEDNMAYGVEVIEPGMAGIDALKDLLVTYFGHRIKRYILGQVLSSEAEATGLGSGVAELHLDTFLQIIRYDARKLEETITQELIEPLKLWNFPAARDIRVKFKIETESPQIEEKLGAWKQAYDMGARLKERDVMDLIGAEMPGPDDRVLQQPQQAAPGMFGGMGPGQQVPAAVAPPASPEQIKGDVAAHVMQSVYGSEEAQDPDGQSVAYVSEGGEWQQRQVPSAEHDTGDRARAGNYAKFAGGQKSLAWNEDDHPRDSDGTFSEKDHESSPHGSDEHEKYADYVRTMGHIGLKPRSLDEWVAAYRDQQTKLKPKGEKPPEEPKTDEIEESTPESAGENTGSALESAQSAEESPEQPSQQAIFSETIEQGATPREAADKSTREDDPEYQFARVSSVRNAGEDLKGSARHKVNAWRGLAEAEADGSAEEMVTRDNLLKAEPHSLMDHVEENPLTAMAMHLAVKKLPPNPGYGDERRRSRSTEAEKKKDREQFVEAYKSVKEKAEELARTEKDPFKALSAMKEHVGGLIDESDESRDRRAAKQAHAESKGLKGHEVTATETKKWEGHGAQRQHDAAKAAAKRHSVNVADVIQGLPDALDLRMSQWYQTEQARSAARRLAGLNAGNLARVENSHRDHSTVPGFDEAAASFAIEHPEMGFGRTGDVAAELWDFIREGATPKPTIHDEETADVAAGMVGRRGQDEESEGDVPDEWASEDDSFDPSRFRRPGNPTRYSWDESKHPRSDDGKFGSGSASHRSLPSHARMVDAAKSGQGGTEAAIDHVMEVRAAAIQDAIPAVAKRLADAARAELGDEAPDDLQEGFEQALRADREIVGARFDLDGLYPEDHFTEDADGNVNGVDEESLAAAIDEAVSTAMRRLESRKTLSKAEKSLVRDHVREIRSELPPEDKLTQSEKPKVAGQQAGLFDREELATGQKSLFNVVRPDKGGKKPAVAPDLLASVSAKVKAALASKVTISPADVAGTQVQEQSLDGQRELFSRVRALVERYLKSNKI